MRNLIKSGVACQKVPIFLINIKLLLPDYLFLWEILENLREKDEIEWKLILMNIVVNSIFRENKVSLDNNKEI